MNDTFRFEPMDWLAFCVTTLIALTVYLFTLAPEVTLQFSGIFSTAAMYLGVSNPPAYPVWTIYSWLAVKLIPFSNIAWRVAFATAFASASTCGLVALVVSRIGIPAAEQFSNFKAFSTREINGARLICSCVAGLGLAFDGCFWKRAVVADQWNFNVFLFALAVALLTRWFFAPEQRRFLYLAAFVQGLILSDSQALFPTILALPFLLILGNPAIGREICFLMASFLWFFLLLDNPFSVLRVGSHNQSVVIMVATAFTAIWAILSVGKREFFHKSRTTTVCVVLFLTGLGTWFLLPLFSMANPPMDWGYPRTVEGFFHVLTRGQYESPYYTESFGRLMTQWRMFLQVAMNDFGVFYSLAALLPLFFVHKVSSAARKWFIGIFFVWFVLSLMTLVGLNPESTRQSIEESKSFFSTSHFLLAILAGNGLLLLVAFLNRRSLNRSPQIKAANL